MTQDKFINELLSESGKILEHFRSTIKTLRTGRASASMLDNIFVDYYGAKTPLNQLSNINTPEARLIVIQPYDRNSIAAIEKSIKESDLNLNPQTDGDVIRLVIPEMNEERRQEIVKTLEQKIEETKIAIRNKREEIWKNLKEGRQQGEVTEDEFYKTEEKLNSVINEKNSEIDKIGEEKKQEIMTI